MLSLYGRRRSRRVLGIGRVQASLCREGLCSTHATSGERGGRGERAQAAHRAATAAAGTAAGSRGKALQRAVHDETTIVGAASIGERARGGGGPSWRGPTSATRLGGEAGRGEERVCVRMPLQLQRRLEWMMGRKKGVGGPLGRGEKVQENLGCLTRRSTPRRLTARRQLTDKVQMTLKRSRFLTK